MNEQIDIDHNIEQLHQSVVVLVMRLALLLFLLDSTYLLLLVGFMALNNYPDTHHYYVVFLSVAHIVKYVVLTVFAVKLVSSWASRTIYISGHHLVMTSGMTSRTQKVYELQQLRLVEVQQGWLGQQLNYGTILLTFTASGFNKDVALRDLSHPKECAKEIEKHLGGVEK